MYSLEYCQANADALAEQVANSWKVHYSLMGADDIPAGFKALLDLAGVYSNAKRDALPAVEVDAARRAFCKAHVAYDDRQPKGD